YTPDAGAQYSPSVSSVTTNECFTAVNKVKPTVTTELHKGATDPAGGPNVVAVGGSVPLGQTMHDKGSVSGGNSAFPGTFTFEFFNNNDCTGSLADSATGVTITSGVADPALVESNLGAGDHAYHAKYVAGSDPYHVDSDF